MLLPGFIQNKTRALELDWITWETFQLIKAHIKHVNTLHRNHARVCNNNFKEIYNLTKNGVTSNLVYATHVDKDPKFNILTVIFYK